ncbi:hypothetical protein [Streptomyces jeddahensis]|uniref:Uncharacterized protein n=1 Tax=Streptomyces jeddahensis TaxID=1716141 RepID=A0A177HKJ3_9ACTN|nr:hypothetical protein [Streptomyces jeddahensis]OAH11130.1 hypothetical protein STSP_55070 [Streptomyces jeddahensis]
MKTRTVAVTTAAVGVAALTLTGMTYASATGSSQSAPQAIADHARYGGEDSEKKDEGKDYDYKKEDKGYDKEDKDYDKGHKGYDKGHKDHDEDKVVVNGQKYPAHKYQCFPVASVQVPNGDGPVADDTFNVENLSNKIVEFFDTINCSNTPEAILSPKSSQFVVDGNVEDDVIVGSFKVIDSHYDHKGDHEGYDD